MGRVEGNVAIVTGAARGLGRAIALRLAAEGADVAVWDQDADRAGETGDAVNALGRRALVQTVDVTSSAAVYAAAPAVIEELGKIDILVNDAGVVSAAPTILDLDDERWALELAVNLGGTFFCTKAVLPHMIARRCGKIVNMASTAGEFGRENTSAGYSASKAGVLGFTMSVARSVAQYGINVNAVSPGVIITEIHAAYSAEQLEVRQARHPAEPRPGAARARAGRPSMSPTRCSSWRRTKPTTSRARASA